MRVTTPRDVGPARCFPGSPTVILDVGRRSGENTPPTRFQKGGRNVGRVLRGRARGRRLGGARRRRGRRGPRGGRLLGGACGRRRRVLRVRVTAPRPGTEAVTAHRARD